MKTGPRMDSAAIKPIHQETFDEDSVKISDDDSIGERIVKELLDEDVTSTKATSEMTDGVIDTSKDNFDEIKIQVLIEAVEAYRGLSKGGRISGEV
jgi:hypothetical protein